MNFTASSSSLLHFCIIRSNLESNCRSSAKCHSIKQKISINMNSSTLENHNAVQPEYILISEFILFRTLFVILHNWTISTFMHKNQTNCGSVGVCFVTEREGRVRFLQLRLCRYFTMNAVSVMAVSVLVLNNFANPVLLWLVAWSDVALFRYLNSGPDHSCNTKGGTVFLRAVLSQWDWERREHEILQ
jgi:hypothetical protein